jgi:transcriptional regulator with XRE-family HTH domain
MRERALPQNPYPFSDTLAADMLRKAVQRAGERGLSLRRLAKELGYKQATVLSHMANGRVPIPLERATEIAEAVDMPAGEFFRAAVAQRNPAAMRLLEPYSSRGDEVGGRMNMATQLVELAGSSLDDLSEDQKQVLREVVLDRNAARRWLSPAEIPLMLLLRKLRPNLGRNGLKSHELSAIERVLS